MGRDYSAGRKYEVKFVNQFGGELVDDMKLQRADIDVILPNGRTVSVKNMTKASSRSGNISLELEQFNTYSGKTIPGNFQSCEADELAIAVTDDGEEHWLRLDVKDFKAWVHKWMNIDKGMPVKSLSPYRISINQREGRYFNNARNLLIPIHVVCRRFRGCKEWIS